LLRIAGLFGSRFVGFATARCFQFPCPLASVRQSDALFPTPFRTFHEPTGILTVLVIVVLVFIRGCFGKQSVLILLVAEKPARLPGVRRLPRPGSAAIQRWKAIDQLFLDLA